MMDVQIMRLIVDDLERDTLPDVVREAAIRWGLPGEEIDAIRYVRSSANHLFRFMRAGRNCYLRLAHASERPEPAIAAELDFVEHAAGAGCAVARPVPSVQGRLIEYVSAHGQRYHAVVFEGLDGRELELEDLDEAGDRAWGRALALVHAASQTFPPHPARPSWRKTLRAALRSLPKDETTVAQVLTAGLHWLDTLTIPDGDYGLLHGDFELDNLLWDDGQVQAIDFDDACYAWYAVDIAIALLDVWLAEDADATSDTPTTQRDERIGWFTDGYATVRPLPDGLSDAMPRLVALILALKIARLMRAYATANANNGPAWLSTMWARHQRWLQAQHALLARIASIWE